MNSIFTLESWLQIATNDLTPEAVVSIRKEITDHVKTTLDYQTNAGLSQVEAEKVAVTLLGDPKRLAKKFRKSYLTTFDQIIIEILGNVKLIIFFSSIFNILLSIYGLKIDFDMYQNGHYTDLASIEQNAKYFSWQIRAILNVLQNSHVLIAGMGSILLVISIYNIKKYVIANFLAIFSLYVFILSILIFVLKLILFVNFKSIIDKFDLFFILFPFVSQVLISNGILWLLILNPILRKLSTRATT